MAAVGLGNMRYACAFREETGITFPLLVDEKREAYRALELKKANIFHLLRCDNTAYRKRAKVGGHEQKKPGKDPFQLGGSFVFGQGNVDLFAHFSDTFGDNAPMAAILAAIP